MIPLLTSNIHHFYRRMFSALCDCLENASPLVHAICLGLDPVQGMSKNNQLSCISPLDKKKKERKKKKACAPLNLIKR